MTAALPRLLRFEDEPEARFFEIEALANTVIMGLTDFDYYEQPAPRTLRSGDEQHATDTVRKLTAVLLRPRRVCLIGLRRGSGGTQAATGLQVGTE